MGRIAVMPRRYLIVDDSNVIRRVAERIMTRRGADVTEAETAERGIALCRLDMPEFIIVDIMLPDMNTLDFIRAVQALPAARRPRIFVLMFQFDLPTLLRCCRAGAIGHIMKPFTAAQLNARLDEIEAEEAAKAA